MTKALKKCSLFNVQLSLAIYGEPVNPHSSNPIDRLISSPRGIHCLYPRNVMATNDIGARLRSFENELLRSTYGCWQIVICGVHKGGKRAQHDVGDLIRFNVGGHLL